jgi:hypothetical protein
MGENLLNGLQYIGEVPCARPRVRADFAVIISILKATSGCIGSTTGLGYGFRSLLLAGMVSVSGPALADPDGRPATPNVTVAGKSDKCPSADFTLFLRAFSNSPVLQRKYTHLPLEFGLLDVSLIGADKENDAFKSSMVNKFEKIPNYYPKSGTVYPTLLQMKKQGLRTEITTIKNSKTGENVFPEETITDPSRVTVLVTLPDTGVIVFYSFRKTQGCWFLYGISDRST